MKLYPYNAPIILTDTIYSLYGGHVTLGTNLTRNAAYRIAEMTASEDVGTLLLPTIVTGTFYYNPLRFITLDYEYVHRVYSVDFVDTEGDIYYTATGTMNVYTSLRDETYGILDIHQLVGNCHCNHGHLGYPYQVRVAYQAGLPSGTSFQPDMLLALTTYADIIMNEIIGYGNEAPGDIGVQDYSNQQYSESRVGLIRTVFGSSARAQFAHRLISKLRKNNYVGL